MSVSSSHTGEQQPNLLLLLRGSIILACPRALIRLRRHSLSRTSLLSARRKDYPGRNNHLTGNNLGLIRPEVRFGAKDYGLREYDFRDTLRTIVRIQFHAKAIKIEEKTPPFRSAFRERWSALCEIFSGCSSFSSSFSFSRRVRSEKKNDRIALGWIFQRRRKFFCCSGPSFPLKRQGLRSQLSASMFFRPSLFLADKIAFTCRHVLILDHDCRKSPCRITTHTSADFSAASPSRFLLFTQRCEFPFSAPRHAHFASYSDSFALYAFCIPPSNASW